MISSSAMSGTGFCMMFATLGVVLVGLVQALGLAPWMAVTGPDEADGGNGKEAGKDGLHWGGRDGFGPGE